MEQGVQLLWQPTPSPATLGVSAWPCKNNEKGPRLGTGHQGRLTVCFDVMMMFSFQIKGDSMVTVCGV